MFNYHSKDLTALEWLVHGIASAALFVATAGIAHLVCYFIRGKKVSLIDSADQKSLQSHFVYYKKRADDGSVSSLARKGYQYRVGRMYLEGKGVAADRDLALDYLQEAADNGSKRAQQLLAQEQQRVQSPVDADKQEAADSAADGPAAVAQVIDQLSSESMDYANVFTDDMVDLIDQHSSAIKQFIQDNIDDDQYDMVLFKLAMLYSGSCISKPRSPQRNGLALAVAILRKLADRNSVPAMSALADLLLNQLHDQKGSRYWLEQAAESNPDAAAALAASPYTKDPAERHKWHLHAAETQYRWNQRGQIPWSELDHRGNMPPKDQYLLQIAHHYWIGACGAPRDKAAAVDWWNKAADQGSHEAKALYGQALFWGNLGDNEPKKGLERLVEACRGETDPFKRQHWQGILGEALRTCASLVEYDGTIPLELQDLDMDTIITLAQQNPKLASEKQDKNGQYPSDVALGRLYAAGA